MAAARALESEFAARDLEVRHVDLLDYTTAPFKQLYRQTYFELVQRAPEVVDWLGKRLDRHPGEDRSRQQRAAARLVRLISFHLPRLISRYQPDIIIHTHFLAPEVINTRLSPDLLQLRRGGRVIPQAVVITDFFAHSLWMQPQVAGYFVASEDVAVHLRASGVDSERIHVSGIPIDPRFAALGSPTAAREQLGLSQSRDLLLLNASGLSGATLREALTYLAALRWPLSIVVVCGRSPEHLEVAQLEADRLHESDDARVDIRAVGFTDQMPTYMAAADLLVSKPGGLTTSEALAAGLPFGVLQPYPVQEEANTSFLLEYGAAMRIDPLTLLSYKVKRFLENDEKRRSMKRSALALAHPDAARVVVDAVLSETFGQS